MYRIPDTYRTECIQHRIGKYDEWDEKQNNCLSASSWTSTAWLFALFVSGTRLFFRVEGIPHHRAIAGVSDSAFDYLGLRSFQMPLSRTDTLININLTITCTIRMNFN